jgi:hypothetical protein
VSILRDPVSHAADPLGVSATIENVRLISLHNPIPHHPKFPHSTPRHSHSIVFVECNALICLRKNFLRVENFRRLNRQMHTAFDFKEEFGRPENSSLSGTIDINQVAS